MPTPCLHGSVGRGGSTTVSYAASTGRVPGQKQEKQGEDRANYHLGVREDGERHRRLEREDVTPMGEGQNKRGEEQGGRRQEEGRKI